MFTRKEQLSVGTLFSKDEISRMEKILNDVFKTELDKENLKFKVYGQIYSDEILMIFSLLPEGDISKLGTCCFVSTDLERPQDQQALTAEMFNATGSIFEFYFNQEEEITMHWTEFQQKGKTYFYRTSRENIYLTLKAEQMLAQS